MKLSVEQARLATLLQARDYQQCEQSLSHFIRSAWDVLEPGKEYLHNWHIDLISEYLEAVTLGQITRLIINEPPRYMKSIQVTVCFPVWTWLRKPSKRIINASYAHSLAQKHSIDRRAIIESQWFKTAWAKKFQLRSDQNTKSDIQNNHRGEMLATSVGGASTGRGGDILIADDPHDPKRAASEVERETAITWFDKTFMRRLDDKINGAVIVVMQRLHEKDLTGHLLKHPGWTHVKIPAEAPTRHTVVFPLSRKEKVREEGDILWPERENKAALEQAKVSLQGDYSGQMQQDPVASTGGFFPRSWWERYEQLPAKYDRKLLVLDCAEKPGVSNDWSVWSVVLETPTGLYWKDVIRKKVGFPDLEQTTLDLVAAEKPDAIVIEDKSAGVQLIQNLQAKTTLPIEPFAPGRDSKLIRASAAQPTVRARNCWLPKNGEWVEIFLSEHEKFPNSEHDDQVDTTSMAVLWLRENGGKAPEPRVRTIG